MAQMELYCHYYQATEKALTTEPVRQIKIELVDIIYSMKYRHRCDIVHELNDIKLPWETTVDLKRQYVTTYKQKSSSNNATLFARKL